MFSYVKNRTLGYIYQAVSFFQWKVNVTSIVLSKEQLRTINALAAKASTPDYISIQRDKREDGFRHVLFLKIVDNQAYWSDRFAVKFDGYSDFLDNLSKKDDNNETVH
jgi:hypothetical protein